MNSVSDIPAEVQKGESTLLLRKEVSVKRAERLQHWLLFGLCCVCLCCAFASASANTTEGQASGSDLEARGVLQSLLDKTVMIAIQELQQTGSVFPYAALLNRQGGLRLIQWPASKAKPTENNMINALRKQLNQAGANPTVVATAYYRDFRAVRNLDKQEQQEGIRVELDHRDYSLIVFLPYVRDENNAITLLEPQFQPGINRTFVRTEDN